MWMRGKDFDAFVEASGLEVSPSDKPEMVWVDLESTGLIPESDPILELGIVLTDSVGRVIRDCAREWLVFDFDDFWYTRALSRMPEVVAQMHFESGLASEIAGMTSHPDREKMSPRYVMKEALHWLRGMVGPGQIPMAGSTIHFDRAFLKKQMPDLEAWFHYRNEDVSSVREFARRVNWSVVENQPRAAKGHRVLSDLSDSIKLYRYFIENFFVLDDPKAVLGG